MTRVRDLLPAFFGLALLLSGCPNAQSQKSSVAPVSYADGGLGLDLTLGGLQGEVSLFPWPGAKLSTRTQNMLHLPIVSSGAGGAETLFLGILFEPNESGKGQRFQLGKCEVSKDDLKGGLEGLLLLPSGDVFPLASAQTEVEFERWEGVAPSKRRLTVMTWSSGELSSRLLYFGAAAGPSEFGTTGAASWPVEGKPEARTARLLGEAVDLVEIEFDTEVGAATVRNRENAAILFSLQRVQRGVWSLAKPDGVAPVGSAD